MKDYSIWFQVFNKDGSINNEDIICYTDTLEEARKKASDDDIIRYYPGCNGAWDWDKAGDKYEEYQTR